MIERTIVEESLTNLSVIDVYTKLVEKRIIFIDEIDQESANGIIGQLLFLDSVNNDPIKIYINSNGGSVMDGFAIYDIAKFIKSPIITIGIGKIASMACILMLLGEERISTKHSMFMLHEISLGSGHDKLSEYKSNLKLGNTLNNYINDIIIEKTDIKDPENLLKTDYWLTSEEAKEIGLITKIV